MELYYIASPFMAATIEGILAHIAAAVKIAAAVNLAGGGKVFAVLPHSMTFPIWQEMGNPPDDQFWYEGDLALLKRCDRLILSPNWAESKGCRDEREHALRWGIPVKVWDSPKG